MNFTRLMMAAPFLLLCMLFHSEVQGGLVDFSSAKVAVNGGSISNEMRAVDRSVTQEEQLSRRVQLISIGAIMLCVMVLWRGRATSQMLRAAIVSLVNPRTQDSSVGGGGALFPGSSAMTWTKDTDGCFVSASKALAEAFGAISPALMVGKQNSDFLAPDVTEQITKFERTVLRSRSSIEMEIQLPGQGGAGVYVCAVMFPLFGEKEQVIGLAGLAFDAMHRKQSALCPENADELDFRSIVENSPDTIARYDVDGKRIYANPTLTNMSKARDVVLIGRTPSETGLLGDMKGYDEVIRTVAQTGEEAEYDLSWFSADGRERLTHIRLVAEWDKNGNVISVLAIGRDISHRRKMEKELWLREMKFRDLADNSPDSIARYDLDARRLYANATLRKMAKECGIDVLDGLTPTETGFLNPADDYEQAILRAGRTGELVDCEMLWPTASGKTIISNVRFVPERDAEDNVVSVLAVGRDITAYKKLEEELRTTSNRLSSIVDTIPGIVYRKTYSPDGVNVTFASDNSQSFTLLSLDEIYGMSLEERLAALWHPEDQSDVAVMVGKVALGAKFAETKARIISPDGNYRWMFIREAVSDIEGDRRTVTGLIMDIHDEVTLKAEADVKARQLAAILNNLSDIAWIKDVNSTFVAGNKALAEMAGLFGPDELVGKTDLDFFPREQGEAFQEGDAEVVRTQKPKHVEEQITHKDGTELWIDTRKAPIFDVSGKVIGSVGMARNITERKKMEEALRETTERLQSIIDNIPAIVYRKTYAADDSRMTFISGHARKIFGQAIENLTQMTQDYRVSALWKAEDRQAVSDMLKRIEKGAQFAETRARLAHPGGKYKWMLLREVVSSVHDGKTNITGIMFDIDDQVRAEETLKETTERMEALVANLPGVVFVKRYAREDSKVLFVSGLVQEIFHVSPNEIYDMPMNTRMRNLWHPDDHSEILDLNRCMREGGQYWEGRVRRRWADGSWRWVMIRERAIETNDDGSLLTGGIIIDIDDQVSAEVAYRESSQRLQNIMENLPGNVFRLRYDAQNRKKFEYMGGRLARDRYISSEDICALSSEELEAIFPPESRKILFEEFPEALREHGHVEARVYVSFGEEMMCQHILETVVGFDRDEMITEGIAIDVTDEVQARQALEQEEAKRRKLKDLLAEERRMAALGEVAGGIAHDFNNMLGVIKGYTEFISEDVPPDTNAGQYAKRILTTSARGQERVEQLLVLTGHKRVDRSKVRLSVFVEDFCADLQVELQAGIRFVDEGIGAAFDCYVDKELIRQALRHLCLNADKASGGEGDVVISLMPARLEDQMRHRYSTRMDQISPWTVECWENDKSVHALTGKLDTDQGWVSIAVTDEGAGMDIDVLKNAFVPFFSTHQRAVNPGLGLPIAQGVALLHGGGLVVKSTPRKGTTAELLLPAIVNGDDR